MEVFGFTRAMSVVMLDMEGQMLNGAHRIAASLAMGLERVPVEPMMIPSDVDQSSLFYRLELTDVSTLLMELARRLLHPWATKRLHVALVWPRAVAQGLVPMVQETFSQLAHLFMPDWSINLTSTACVNTIRQLHAGEAWIDAHAERQARMLCCGGSRGSIFVFETPLEAQDRVTGGVAALHRRAPLAAKAMYITQDAEDVERALAAVLHPPTMTFLRTAWPRTRWTRLPHPELLEALPERASGHCVFDGGAVMQAHGLASTSKLELICDDAVQVPNSEAFVDHGKQLWLSMHSVEDPSDLVHDPRRYFVVDGWRFVAPWQLKVFKLSRHRALCKGSPCTHDGDLEDIVALEKLYGGALQPPPIKDL